MCTEQKLRLDAWARLQELKTERASLVSQRSKGRDLHADRALIQDGAGAGRLCAGAPSADGATFNRGSQDSRNQARQFLHFKGTSKECILRRKESMPEERFRKVG